MKDMHSDMDPRQHQGDPQGDPQLKQLMHDIPRLAGSSHLQLAGSAEAGTLLQLLDDHLVDLVIAVAADRRAPAAHVVDVLVVVHVPSISALDAVEDDGATTD